MEGKKAPHQSMQWSKPQDVFLYREVLALEPYKHKKGSTEAGRIWTDIAQSLKQCKYLTFKKNPTQRGVRERFALLQTKFKEQERAELKASGISPEQDEVDVLIEEITEREKVADESKDIASKKKEEDKATAEDIRTQALERMGQTKKRKSEEDEDMCIKEKRKRRNGSEAIEFLQEKCEMEMALREKELEIKAKEQEDKTNQFELMFRQQQSMMQVVQQQHVQQQQQSQSQQMLMAQQNKAIMSLLEKVVSKHD